MIELIPAIDIMDGKCVRLTKGDYNQQTVYSNSPVEMAKAFEAAGIRRLHVVDLDGAKSKHVVNLDTLKGITASTNLTVDFGGGIKTDEDIENVFACGASMVTIGSVAVTQKGLFGKWLDKFGADRIILGADLRNGNISINGWNEDTSENLVSFLEHYVSLGIKNVLCTDISKDGMMQGPSFSLYKEILSAFPGINLIASGGVSCVEDIKRLDLDGVPSVILGKAIYEGSIDIKSLVSEIAGCKNVKFHQGRANNQPIV